MKFLDSVRKALAEFIKGKQPYEVAVENFVKELQKSLLRADVNVKLVLELSKRIRERALKERPPAYVSKREWFVKIVYDELSQLFGGDRKPQVFPSKTPYVIMLVGVQGSGKTTTAAKIAYFYKRYKYRPCLICTDTYRPAAYDQLAQLAKQIDVPMCGDPKSKDPVDIARRCIDWCISRGSDIIIVDTAGRHGYGSEQALLEEMKAIADAVKPDEIMMIIDASMGQKAFDLAKRFHEFTPIGSIAITKLDGTAKGGGALSAVAATGAQIKFIGVGEKIPEIEVFEPRRFVGRLLGFGDLPALIERLKELEHREELEKRFRRAIASGKITLADLYVQLKSMRKLGPLSKLLQLIPGFSLLPIDESQVKLSEEKMRKWLAILDSMSYEELRNPSIIDRRRVIRIARGSGTSPEDVKELLKYYDMVRHMIKNIKRRGFLRRLGIDLSKLDTEG
ncbi:MAG: signal recognition particle protein [Crenarchaeota archaeon]|nr:signal recognition particle protein [Thermoproteota archaeon]